MSAWRDLSAAPLNGTPLLLRLSQPVDGGDLVGWCPVREIQVTIGWWNGYRWESHLLEDGTADTEGYSSPAPIKIMPDAWMPVPEVGS